jgi:hypothetical protein
MVIFMIFTEPPGPTRRAPGLARLQATRDASVLGHHMIFGARESLEDVGFLWQFPAIRL